MAAYCRPAKPESSRKVAATAEEMALFKGACSICWYIDPGRRSLRFDCPGLASFGLSSPDRWSIGRTQLFNLLNREQPDLLDLPPIGCFRVFYPRISSVFAGGFCRLQLQRDRVHTFLRVFSFLLDSQRFDL